MDVLARWRSAPPMWQVAMRHLVRAALRTVPSGEEFVEQVLFGTPAQAARVTATPALAALVEALDRRLGSLASQIESKAPDEAQAERLIAANAAGLQPRFDALQAAVRPHVQALAAAVAAPAQPRGAPAAGATVGVPGSGRERPVGATGRSSLPAAPGGPAPPAARGGAPAPPDATTREFVNSLGLTLRLVEPGTFTMGDKEEKDNPPHRVTLTLPFHVGTHEVTNAQYRQFNARHDAGAFQGRSLAGPDQPVVMVCWNDAKSFCAWLTARERKERRIRATQEYRLPTEAEWEYCCRAGRAGDQAKFPWGSWWPPKGKAGNYCGETARLAFAGWKYLAGYREGFAVTAPVGSFDPNPWGLYDLGGNVWEWCEDWHHGKFTKADRSDPRGPASGTTRVLRGGSWRNAEPAQLRTANRGAATPVTARDSFGFRIVLAAFRP